MQGSTERAADEGLVGGIGRGGGESAAIESVFRRAAIDGRRTGQSTVGSMWWLRGMYAERLGAENFLGVGIRRRARGTTRAASGQTSPAGHSARPLVSSGRNRGSRGDGFVRLVVALWPVSNVFELGPRIKQAPDGRGMGIEGKSGKGMAGQNRCQRPPTGTTRTWKPRS